MHLAERNGWKLKREPAFLPHAPLDRFGELAEVVVAVVELRPCLCDADDWFGQVLLGKPHCLGECSPGEAGRSASFAKETGAAPQSRRPVSHRLGCRPGIGSRALWQSLRAERCISAGGIARVVIALGVAVGRWWPVHDAHDAVPVVV